MQPFVCQLCLQQPRMSSNNAVNTVCLPVQTARASALHTAAQLQDRCYVASLKLAHHITPSPTKSRQAYLARSEHRREFHGGSFRIRQSDLNADVLAIVAAAESELLAWPPPALPPPALLNADPECSTVVYSRSSLAGFDVWLQHVKGRRAGHGSQRP